MAKAELRMLFNILLVVWFLGYGAFLLFTDYGNASWSLIFISVFVVILSLRDIIAPKQKRSDKDGDN